MRFEPQLVGKEPFVGIPKKGSSVKDQDPSGLSADLNSDLTSVSLGAFRSLMRNQAKSLGTWELLPQFFLQLIEKTRPARVGIFSPKSEWAEANNVESIFKSLPHPLQEHTKVYPHRIDGDQLVFSKSEAEEEEVPDLLLIPALACDLKGNRIGRGKGYYDRYLSRHAGQLQSCVILHSSFVYEQLPSSYLHSGDQPVQYVLTEKKLITTNNNKNGNEVPS